MTPPTQSVASGRSAAPSSRARTSTSSSSGRSPDDRPPQLVNAPTVAPPAAGGQVVLVADLHPEVAERSEVLGHAVSAVNGVVGDFGGQLTAVLGSKVVATFPVDRVLDAVGAAVTVQRRAAESGDEDRWMATSSLVTGEQPAIAGLDVPVVGDAVERALLLCQSAHTAEVLADEPTASAARTAASSLEDGTGWSPGDRRLLFQQGSAGFAYCEIEFPHAGPAPQPSRAARRARPAPSRRAPDRRPSTRPERAPASAPFGTGAREGSPRRRSWSRGRVCCWFTDRGRGVVASSTGQEFYVDRRFLVVSSDLTTGASVFFVPRDPVARGRNPVAGAVLVEGAQIEARVEHVDEQGAFGFAQVTDSNSTRQLLLIDLTSVGRASPGEWLLVEVRRGEHGPVAVPV